ncbi:MAG: autotransporter outer membrane beta-barrel domain-containing protein [Sulfuritalea sp.]|nr:autotransporter outer membrane beta-barrel domain-containing protein [Sulfuritalea sp.]
MIKQIRYVFAAGILAASGAASATDCPTAISSFNSCSGTPAQIASCQASIKGSHPECFGAAGGAAAATKNVQATSLEQILAISANISRPVTATAPPGVVASDSGARKGLAAGNPAGKWNAWASVSETDIDYDRGTYFLNAANRTNKFDSRIQTVVLGADYRWAPDLVFGFSIAADSGSGSASSYTIAAPDAAKSVSSSGTSYAPYFGWQINKDWALDGTIGMGTGDSTTGGTVTSDSKRVFYGLNATYSRWYGNWQVNGKGSYLVGREDNDNARNNGVVVANSKVSNEIAQGRVGVQAAYWMNGFMPYAGLSYSRDFRTSTASADELYGTEIGESAYTWSLGVNFISIKNALTGGIGFEQETGRDRSKNKKLMANINVRF